MRAVNDGAEIDGAATGGGTASVSVWRRRDFRIAWSAGFVNDTGDWVLNVALPVFVFVETGSGAQTAVLFVCQLLAAALFGPIGGAIVDRTDLRRALVATNVLQALFLAPLLAVSADRVWPAYLVVVAQALLSQVNNPANVALLPRVVADDELAVANAALSASASLARLGGAPLGGLLVAWQGLGPVVAVDTASFLIVAVALGFLRADTAPVPHPDGADEPKGVKAGWRAVRAAPPLPTMLTLHGTTQIAQGGFVVMFVAFIVETLGDDGGAVGIIRGTMAIGALAGAALVGRFARRVPSTTLYAAGLVGMGLVSFVFWNAPTVTTATWVYVVLFSLSGFPGAALSVGMVTTVQTASPRHALGRISGMFNTADALGTALGSILAGALIDHLALRPLLDVAVRHLPHRWHRRVRPAPPSQLLLGQFAELVGHAAAAAQRHRRVADRSLAEALPHPVHRVIHRPTRRAGGGAGAQRRVRHHR